MKLTKSLRMLGIVAALIGTTAVQSFALPANEKETVYFSDATMTNVIWNCLATGVIAKWEGEFVEASDQELAVAAARGEI